LKNPLAGLDNRDRADLGRRQNKYSLVVNEFLGWFGRLPFGQARQPADMGGR
jgi:hypothetical protein